MKNYCKYVNVFQGIDEIDLPKPQGVAAAWKFIKGLCGNNTPAAALPFGRIMAGINVRITMATARYTVSTAARIVLSMYVFSFMA